MYRFSFIEYLPTVFSIECSYICCISNIHYGIHFHESAALCCAKPLLCAKLRICTQEHDHDRLGTASLTCIDYSNNKLHILFSENSVYILVWMCNSELSFLSTK